MWRGSKRPKVTANYVLWEKMVDRRSDCWWAWERLFSDCIRSFIPRNINTERYLRQDNTACVASQVPNESQWFVTKYVETITAEDLLKWGSRVHINNSVPYAGHHSILRSSASKQQSLWLEINKARQFNRPCHVTTKKGIQNAAAQVLSATLAGPSVYMQVILITCA